MPIFMDLHQLPSDYHPTREELYQTHARDSANLGEYGVTYMVYIVTMEARSIFCIIKASDADSCITLHKKSHGVGPCYIIEVKSGEFVSFISEKSSVNEFDMLELVKGVPDTGYRTILAMEYLALPGEEEFFDTYSEMLANTPGANRVDNSQGELISFHDSDHAVQFAIKLNKSFKQFHNNSHGELRIGIATGLPVTEGNSNIFGETIDLALHLCEIGKNGSIIVSSLTGKLLHQGYENNGNVVPVRILGMDEEKFLTPMTETMDELEEMSSMNLQTLADRLHISQSGIYRKMNALAGTSVSGYLQDIRLRRSFKQIKGQDGNISQIAYDSGFKSPSYFTRSFKKRFGIQPTLLSRLVKTG